MFRSARVELVLGVVLLAITMALWPFIYQVLHGDVEQSEWRASVKIWTEREENDQVKANKKFEEWELSERHQKAGNARWRTR